MQDRAASNFIGVGDARLEQMDDFRLMRVNEVAKPTSPPAQNFCSLYGTTTMFDASTLKTLYPTHDAFVSRFVNAVDRITKQGYWLAAEAAEAKEAARRSSIGR